jgi:hypothetical protein
VVGLDPGIVCLGSSVDSKLLIDAIVRQTTVLIAALSTASGIRAPLAHVADQVFLDLAKEIESHGIGRKVVADMFGLALRTYQQKVQRLTESMSTRNRSLWEAVLQHILEHGPTSRRQLDAQFAEDAAEDVGAVLHDLVASGLLQASRRDRDAVYQPHAARPPGHGAPARDLEALAALAWVTIYRRVATTRPTLAQALSSTPDEIERAVSLLIADGRVQRVGEGEDLRADSFVVRVGEKRGWEAAVFDHFSAVASAIAAKVQRGPGSRADDRGGGATLSFDLYAGHPNEAEVYGLLARIRADVNELWSRVSTENRSHPIADADKVKVTFYFGQRVEENLELAPAREEGSHES